MTDVVLTLHTRDLTIEDLPYCSFAGTPHHLTDVRRQLLRAAKNEVDYLAVCTKADLPVAIGGVDYAPVPEAGTIWQLAVDPALQGVGIGTYLIGAAEERIRHRGLATAELAVEVDNPRARALYERLGYSAYGQQTESWQLADGTLNSALCDLLRKHLG